MRKILLLALISTYAAAQTPLPAPGTVIVINPTPAQPPGHGKTTIYTPGQPAVVCITVPVPGTKTVRVVCQ